MAAVTIFIGMAILPTIESIFRLLPFKSLTASQVIVQHLTLWIGFVGAILASEKNKLLCLSRETIFNKEKNFTFFRFIPKAVSFLVLIGLAYGSWELLKVEFNFPVDIAPGIPRWFAQIVMFLGFSFMSLNILVQSYKKIEHRFMLLVVASVLIFTPFSTIVSEYLPIVPICIFIIFYSVLKGAPIMIGLGGAAIILFWNDFSPLASIPAETYRMVVSPTLATIPLFTLGGYLLAESKASERLIIVFKEIFGWIPGGTPIIIILICAFFTALTGGSGVTILALGGLLLPLLINDGYSRLFSIGLITVSGSLGLLFPPSLPLIIYGVTAGVSVKKIFLGGLLPGLLLIIFLSIWSVLNSSNNNKKKSYFNLFRSLEILWKTKFELFIPILILFGVFGGFTTIVETASITLLYILYIEVFVFKDIKINQLPKIIINCSTLIGGVLIILGVAMGLTSYLIDAQVPIIALEWIKSMITSKYIFLLLLNLFLLVVGCLMDIFSAIIVVVPLITPIALHFGIDPVHIAVIFIANLELGFLTPPVGMNLFLSAYRFNQNMQTIYKATFPFFIVKVIAVLIITYFPFITLFFQ